MNTRIAVCGHNAEARINLIRSVTPRGTIPETPPTGNVVYETENIDYLDCAVPVQEIGQRFEINFDSSAPDRADAVWYCLDGNSGVDELQQAAGLTGRVLFVVTDGDELDGEKLEKRISMLEQTGFDREKIIIVSLRERTGLVLLIEQTIRPLGGTLEEKDPELEALRRKTSEEANSFIYWASGRAFAIALVPLPMADVLPLVANEAYMFYKLGALYGYAVNKTILAGFLGCLGASVGGKIAVSFVPFLKAPIAAGITYGVGYAAKAYFESGMKLDQEMLRDIFLKSKKKGEEVNWKEKN